MSDAKAIRLNKVARELNVGLHTIVDFLHSKGHKDVENNPNAKIDSDLYHLLLAEFQTEKSDKEKSRKVNTVREKRETITLSDATKRPVEENETEAEEIMIKNVTSTPQEPELVKQKVESDVKVSVVGKIDLDSVNSKTRPDKKAKAGKEKPTENPSSKIPEAKKVVEPVVEEKVVEVKEEVRPEEIETIKTEYKQLSGPKVLGKIELPVEKTP